MGLGEFSAAAAGAVTVTVAEATAVAAGEIATVTSNVELSE